MKDSTKWTMEVIQDEQHRTKNLGEQNSIFLEDKIQPEDSKDDNGIKELGEQLERSKNRLAAMKVNGQ